MIGFNGLVSASMLSRQGALLFPKANLSKSPRTTSVSNPEPTLRDCVQSVLDQAQIQTGGENENETKSSNAAERTLQASGMRMDEADPTRCYTDAEARSRPHTSEIKSTLLSTGTGPNSKLLKIQYELCGNLIFDPESINSEKDSRTQLSRHWAASRDGSISPAISLEHKSATELSILKAILDNPDNAKILAKTMSDPNGRAVGSVGDVTLDPDQTSFIFGNRYFGVPGVRGVTLGPGAKRSGVKNDGSMTVRNILLSVFPGKEGSE